MSSTSLAPWGAVLSLLSPHYLLGVLWAPTEVSVAPLLPPRVKPLHTASETSSRFHTMSVYPCGCSYAYPITCQLKLLGNLLKIQLRIYYSSMRTHAVLYNWTPELSGKEAVVQDGKIIEGKTCDASLMRVLSHLRVHALFHRAAKYHRVLRYVHPN